jgi:hypothetical protein
MSPPDRNSPTARRKHPVSAKPFIFEQSIFEESFFPPFRRAFYRPNRSNPLFPPDLPTGPFPTCSRRPVQIAASPHELLVFGGNGGDGLLNDAWLFDLRASQWVLTDARRRHAGMGGSNGGGEAVPEGREWHALHRSVLWPDHTAVRGRGHGFERERAHPGHICTGTGLALPTAVPEVGSPLDHICTGTGLALRVPPAPELVHIPASTSAPGLELGSPLLPRRRRAQIWAHPRPRPRRD